MNIELMITAVKQLIKDLADEKYEQERKGLSKAALHLVDEIFKEKQTVRVSGKDLERKIKADFDVVDSARFAIEQLKKQSKTKFYYITGTLGCAEAYYEGYYNQARYPVFSFREHRKVLFENHAAAEQVLEEIKLRLISIQNPRIVSINL